MTIENRIAGAARPSDDSHELGRWATTHFGIVTRTKLRALGLSDSEIRSRIRGGTLLRAAPSVYYVGHRSGVVGQREAIAVATAGAGARLWGVSAAGWSGLTEPWRGPVHLVVPAARKRSPPGAVHHVAELLDGDRCVWRGIPCVTPERAVMDLPPAALRQALQWLMREGRPLEPILQRMHGRRGARAFREEVERLVPQLAHTMSELEARFVRLCARHGIGIPIVNGVMAGGDLLDCVWPGSTLIVELDGRRWHAHRDIEDRARDRRRVLEGRRTLRYGWSDVTRAETMVAEELRRALAM